MSAIKRALAAAGGKIEDKRWACRQVEMKTLTDPAGWASYMLKNKRWGKTLPEGRSIYIARSLASIAKKEYQQFGLSKELTFTKRRSSSVN